MVNPFIKDRRWKELLGCAEAAWQRIFRHFKNLEKISVGCCERVDQPQPTSTSRFIVQYGRHVIEDIQPKLYEDATVNLAWASSIILKCAPSSVRTLELSMANVDMFDTDSPILRLLQTGYLNKHNVRGSVNVTRLNLSIRGAAGTHGSQLRHDAFWYIGSIGCVLFWKRTLEAMRHLQHLEIRNCMSDNDELNFSDMQQSDPGACILDWLLPRLTLHRLVTLRLCDFVLDKATMAKTFTGNWPKLEKLILDRVQIMERGFFKESDQYLTEHLGGHSWVNLCRTIIEKQPGLCIELNQASSSDVGTERQQIEERYEEELQEIPGVVLNGSKAKAS